MNVKFRGKSVVDEAWLYGDLVHSADGSRTGILVSDKSTYEECEVYPGTVCVSTGIQDINGSDIYSDDIISICLYCGKVKTAEGVFTDLRKRGIGIVFYDSELARWRVRQKNIVVNLVNKKEAKSIRFKVLGNIHDKPEYNRLYPGEQAL
ncbi:MAG: YopX family protein [Clostridia bacterium]|nr:YopX family protein [Clostridia bacterium]